MNFVVASANDSLLSPAQLKLNSFWGMARSVIATLLFALSYPIYFKFLGIEVFGVSVMLMAVVNYSQIGAAKLSQATTKFIAESLAQEDVVRICKYSSSLIGAILAVGLVILALTVPCRGLLAGFFPAPPSAQSQLPLIVALSALIILLAMLAEAFGGIVSGTGRMDQVFISEIICRVVTFLTSVALLWLEYGLVAIFWGAVAGNLVYCSLGAIFTKRSLRFFPISPRHFDWPRLRQVTRFAGPLMWGAMFSCSVGPFNRILLGSMISPAAASIYEVAQKGAVVLRAHAETGIRPLMPQMSGLQALDSHDHVRALCLGAVRTVIIWGTPLFITFSVAASYLIPLWLGRSANQEMTANLHILLWGNYALLLGLPFFYTSMGMGRPVNCLMAELLQSVTGVALASMGIYLVREIWVVSSASCLGMTMFSLTSMFLFFGSWKETWSMMVKGTRASLLPLLIFSPLLLLKENLILFCGLSGGAYLLYIVYLHRAKKISLFR